MLPDDPTWFLLCEWPAARVILSADEVDDWVAIQQRLVEAAVSLGADVFDE